MVSEVRDYDTDVEDDDLDDKQSVDAARDVNSSLGIVVPPRRRARLPRGKALPAIGWAEEPGAPHSDSAGADGANVGPEPPAPFDGWRNDHWEDDAAGASADDVIGPLSPEA